MSQAERLKRLSELLIELFRSPIPTHFFQTLGDHAGSAVPHDYLAVCLADPEKGSYLVHTLAGLDAGAVSLRGFSHLRGAAGTRDEHGTAAANRRPGARSRRRATISRAC